MWDKGTSGGRRFHWKLFYNSIEESQDWNGGREMSREGMATRDVTNNESIGLAG